MDLLLKLIFRFGMDKDLASWYEFHDLIFNPVTDFMNLFQRQVWLQVNIDFNKSIGTGSPDFNVMEPHNFRKSLKDFLSFQWIRSGLYQSVHPCSFFQVCMK